MVQMYIKTSKDFSILVIARESFHEKSKQKYNKYNKYKMCIQFRNLIQIQLQSLTMSLCWDLIKNT